MNGKIVMPGERLSTSEELLPGEQGLVLKAFRSGDRYKNETEAMEYMTKYFPGFFP